MRPILVACSKNLSAPRVPRVTQSPAGDNGKIAKLVRAAIGARDGYIPLIYCKMNLFIYIT